MECSYKIKDFRVFDSNGARFNFKPITILTGANCAGKSSLVKSLLLLKGFFKQGDGKDFCIGKTPLPFSNENVYINGIDNAINYGSKEDGQLVFSMFQKGLTDNVSYEMELSFSSKESDILNNGWLNRIRLSCVIDDISDVFLDVSVDQEGKMSFDTMNLSGNIYRDFKRELEIAACKELLSLCRPSWYFEENFSTQESIDEQNEKINFIARIIKSNPLNGTLDFPDLPPHPAVFIYDIVKRGCRIPVIDDEQKFNDVKFNVNFDRWKQFADTGILLNLPILDEIRGMDASEFSLYISNVKKNFDEKCMSLDDLDLLVSQDVTSAIDALLNKVVNAFSASGFSSFGEYYKKLEDNALADVGQLCDKSIVNNWRNLFVGMASKGDGFAAAINSLVNMLAINDVDAYYNNTSAYLNFALEREVDFYYVYRALTYLERNRDVTNHAKYWDDNGFEHYSYKSVDSIKWEEDWRYFDYPVPQVFSCYRDFISNILLGFVKGEDFLGITSVGSFLCPVLRSYSIYDKNNPISSVLISYFDAQMKIRQNNISMRDFQYGSFINKWIVSFGIGDSVDIMPNDDKTAFKICIESNNKKISSADYGHGVTQLLYILINIETAIISHFLNEKNLITLCFEEPEVSLHPSWQSKLAEIFKEAYDLYDIQFILETHSEYLIRATQAMVAKECETNKDLRAFPFVVYYMEKSGAAYDLQYQMSGRFNRSFGKGFFDEAGRASIEILKRERRMRNE